MHLKVPNLYTRVCMCFLCVADWFPGWKQHFWYNKQPNDDGYSDQDCVEIRQTFR